MRLSTALVAALVAATAACGNTDDDRVQPPVRSASGVLLPAGASVYLGTREVEVLEWTPNRIRVRIPDDAPVGETMLTVYVGGKRVGEIGFGVVSNKDPRYQDPDGVGFFPDARQYIAAIHNALRNIAQRDGIPELDDFAKKLEKLLEKAENGEISKQELLDELAKAEQALNKGNEPDPAEVQKQLADMGKELAKQQLTKELGEALQKNDLDKAKQEFEKLADKLANKELNEKQKEELGKQLQKVADQMQKQEQDRQKKQDSEQKKVEDQIQKLQKEIRRLEKKNDPKSQQQRQEMERRLEQKKRELEKLKKDEEQRQQSEQRRAVKRLQKDLEKAAENLQKPQKNQSQEEQEQNEQQASRSMKDAARETGRVDRDQRKQATQKKMSSQMDDLREAMRRAKQRGNKGPNDPFNKNGKNQDFIARARGQKGQGQAWKPGQGQRGLGQGQGQGQNGGQGSGSGQQSSTWGTGHDDNLTGDPTGKSGDTKDQELQGVQGHEGGSIRETILAAAQKGFASARYQKVYQDYQRIVEEVMRTEKLPSSYKYYVKRYFAKIHPSMTEGQ
jgi:chemotaxis protein histidine kinase CheA